MCCERLLLQKSPPFKPDECLKHLLFFSQVKREDMAAVMQALGADWDEDELEDCILALDPSDSGSVHLSDFVEWWSN